MLTLLCIKLRIVFRLLFRMRILCWFRVILILPSAQLESRRHVGLAAVRLTAVKLRPFHDGKKQETTPDGNSSKARHGLRFSLEPGSTTATERRPKIKIIQPKIIRPFARATCATSATR